MLSWDFAKLGEGIERLPASSLRQPAGGNLKGMLATKHMPDLFAPPVKTTTTLASWNF